MENKKPSRFGVVGMVAAAFFIAEFGDKTELATVSLVAQYQNAISVFVGATVGMLLADGIGIVVGVIFCKRIPQRTFNWVSAVIFVLFGLIGVYQVLPVYVGLVYTALILLVLTVFSVATMVVLAKRQKKSKTVKEARLRS